MGYLPLLFYCLPSIGFIFLLKYYIQTRYHHFIPSLYEYLMPALLSFALVIAVIPLCMIVARRFKIQDMSGGIKGRLGPTPLLGGLGIFIAFMVTAFFYQPWTPEMKAIIIGAAIIALMGTIDDIRPLSSIIRLCGQLLASAIVISAGVKVSFMPHTWWGECLAFGVTSVWILGIVNATNFADGADGLATGFSAIAAIFFFLIALHLDQFGVAILASILIGCGLGFLVFNFKPAKIYLGDGGSTFLGFLLACLSLYGGVV